VILASSLLQIMRMATEVHAISWGELLLGVVLSAISAGLCIHYFLRLIEKTGMLPFVIYRVLLGIVIIAVVA
jgi:undecaprenyl-diphosphatase